MSEVYQVIALGFNGVSVLTTGGVTLSMALIMAESGLKLPIVKRVIIEVIG